MEDTDKPEHVNLKEIADLVRQDLGPLAIARFNSGCVLCF